MTVATALVLVVLTADPAVAESCGPPPTVAFVGYAASIDRTELTFRVERVVSDPAGSDLVPGSDVVVDYGDEAGLVEVGRSYRVQTSGLRQDWASRVAGPEGGCGGAGMTTFADGTTIPVSWWTTHKTIRGLLLVGALSAAILASIAIATAAWKGMAGARSRVGPRGGPARTRRGRA
jgi:hypothetical protein